MRQWYCRTYLGAVVMMMMMMMMMATYISSECAPAKVRASYDLLPNHPKRAVHKHVSITISGGNHVQCRM